MEIKEMTFGDSGKQNQEYLFSPSKVFKITKFQRPYTWEQYQVDGVIQDVKYILKNNETVGWPSMLIQKVDSGDLGLNNFLLGDGQQRSTTVFLYLTAIWQFWKKEFLHKDNSVEDAFFKKLFYIGKEREKGVLGRKSYGEIFTTIDFQTPAAVEKIHNLFEIYQIDEAIISSLKKSINNKDDCYQIYNTFLMFWNELYKIKRSENDLKRITEIILTKIVFPVIVYNEDENMFRAFANTNSFGEPLTQSDLVKAEIYGRTKLIDSQLADRIAKYWNEEMSPWFAKNSTTATDFDWFLTEEFNIFNNWSFVSKKSQEEYDKKKNQRNRWLKTEWQKYFDNKSEELNNDSYLLKEFYEDMFEKIKSHFLILKVIIENKPTEVLSKNWEIQYTWDVYSSIRISIIFYLNDSMNEKDFKKTMSLLRKYYFYNRIVLNDKNSQQLLIHNDSPIRTDKELTYENILNYLITKSSKKGGKSWRNQKETEDFLCKRSFSNEQNSDLCKLLIYINNEKFIEKGHESEQNNTSKINTCSREHIIPQKSLNYNEMSLEEIELYDEKISKIGNLLIITGSENSSIKNSKVENKIKVYEKSESTPWGTNWIRDFIDHYNKNTDKWNNHQKYLQVIDERSAIISQEVAKYLYCPVVDEKILEENPEDIVWLEIKDTQGNSSNGDKIRTTLVNYLKELVKDENIRQILINQSEKKSCFYFSKATDTEKEFKNITEIEENLYIKDAYLKKSDIITIINELRSSIPYYQFSVKTKTKEELEKESIGFLENNKNPIVEI